MEKFGSSLNVPSPRKSISSTSHLSRTVLSSDEQKENNSNFFIFLFCCRAKLSRATGAALTSNELNVGDKEERMSCSRCQEKFFVYLQEKQMKRLSSLVTQDNWHYKLFEHRSSYPKGRFGILSNLRPFLPTRKNFWSNEIRSFITLCNRQRNLSYDPMKHRSTATIIDSNPRDRFVEKLLFRFYKSYLWNAFDW